MSPPAALGHDPLASVIVTLIVLAFAACVFFLVAIGLEIALVALHQEPRPISYARAIERLRKAVGQK